jgi:putative membrane protein insertion efficiency factor
MIRAFILLTLRGYKAMLSPLLPNACRFVPTCSEYAMEVIDHYGPWRGAWKVLWRLLRCHPFAQGGYDPVILPETPAGTPACVCHSRDVAINVGDPALAGASPLSDISSTNLRLNSVRRC